MYASTEQALLRRVATEQSTGRAPSIVAGVYRDGTLLWTGGRGTTLGTATARPNANTQFRIGSITKTFVAAHVLKLREEGLVELNDPLGKFLPDTPFSNATIAQLLSHTAGVTSELPGQWWERVQGGSWDDLVTAVADQEHIHRPGHQHHYSNVGYGILGQLVAHLRGTTWRKALQTDILDPLGLTRTTPRPELPHAQGFGVHPFAQVVLAEPEHDAGSMGPAGQLWSTVTDLTRWGAFLAGDTGGVISEESAKLLRTPIAVADGDFWSAGSGLGLQLWRDRGRRLAGHSGSMPGFVASLVVDPASKTGAVAFANTTSGIGIVTLTFDLIDMIEELEPELPKEWTPTPIEPALLEDLGLWHWGVTPMHLRVLGDGSLELIPAGSGGRSSRFAPNGDGTYTGLDNYYHGEKLTFVRDAFGTATHINLATFIFTRTPYDPKEPIPGGVTGWN